MAKIGPSLPPQVPRGQPQEPQGPGARPPPQPSAPPRRPPTAGPPPQSAQQVAQQFGTAFTSAGRLATQLVKGLFPGAAPAARPAPQERTGTKTALPRAQPSSTAERGEASVGPGARTPAKEGSEPGFIGAAFAALRRARGKRAEKSRRKKRPGKTGSARAVDAYHAREEDTEEDVSGRQELRTYLRGDEAEENTYEEARREARRLEEMGRQGEPPSRILSQVNAQLGGDRGPQFKRQFIDEVRPQLDRLAEGVGRVSTDERRKLTAFVSRAVHQAGTQNAAGFDTLMRATATAEAAHLAADSSTPLPARAAELAQALRAAPSALFRAALLEQSHALVESLGRESALAPAEALHDTLVSLLRAAEVLPGPSVTALADIFLKGQGTAARPEAPGVLAEALAPALRAAPAGAFWALQLQMYLEVRGEAAAAQRTAQVLEALLVEARTPCTPLLPARRDRNRSPEPGAAEAFEQATVLAARLLPACGALYALRERLPATLADEALLLLAATDQLGASAAGQQALRQALLAQERNEWTFLSILPQVARTLSQPAFLKTLRARKLSPVAWPSHPSAFLQEVATQLAQALGAPVVAWSQKGDAAAARSLLRTALYLNASLFGLSTEAAGVAAGLFEDLRARPKPRAAQPLIQRLHELAQQHPPEDRSGSIRSLKGLVTALAQRDPSAAPAEVRTRTHNEDAVRMTSLEVAAVQTSLVRERAEKRAAEEEAKKKAAAPRGRRPPR